MAVLLASLSSLTFGVSDFIGGVTTRRTPVLVVVLWSQLAGLLVAVVGAPLFGGSLSSGAVFWGAAGGIGGAVGIVALYRGIAAGDAAIVAPVAAVIGAAIPVAFGVATGDRPGVAAWFGIAAALPALWMVSYTAHSNSAARFGAGVIAGMGFGAFFVLMARAPDGAALWPLVPARAASVTMILGLLAWRRDRMVPEPRSTAVLAGIVAAGAGDMVANMLFLSAVQRGLLSVVAVLSSMYPAATVALARVFGERLAPTQWLGVALSLVSVGLIVA